MSEKKCLRTKIANVKNPLQIFSICPAKILPQASNMAVNNLSPTSATMYWQMNDLNETFEAVSEYIITLDEIHSDGSAEFGSWSTQGKQKIQTRHPKANHMTPSRILDVLEVTAFAHI